MADLRIAELRREFDKCIKLAEEAMDKSDFYNLVANLRKAADCKQRMSELSPEKKHAYLAEADEYRSRADKWELAHPEAFSNTTQGAKQSQALKIEPHESTGTCFNDVIGCDDVKRFVEIQYKKRFDEKYKAVFADGRGGSLQRGMLLYGLPGTGKTLLARAIATEVKADFISVKASDLKDRFYGDTEKKIQELYDQAAKKGVLTIIFIDEIETLLPSRSGTDIQNYEASAVTQFLAVLDGFEKEKMSKIITIAASNYPNRIDPAAIRPGRIGAWFRVDLPNAKLREKLIGKHFEKGYVMENDARDYLIRMTKGYSSADIVSVCDRLKGDLAENGIEAVDKGYSDDMVITISSKVVMDDAEKIIRTSNSSVSRDSVYELIKFEKNYNCKGSDGTLEEFMQNLT